MCPDRQIISLYFDGELPSPWKEKLEVHLESCPGCRADLEGYRVLQNRLEKNSPPGGSAGERVWANLVSPEPVSGKDVFRREFFRGRGIWRRTVTLPLPAAAAAAVIIIIAFFAALDMGSPGPTVPQDAVASGLGLDDQSMVSVPDMKGVLQYLSSQDNGDFMVIRLPESRNFSRAGDPALINAADYSRRAASR
jgi:anti-sigma factor RsiW